MNDDDVRSFFATFEAASGAGDTAALGACFAETFLAGDAEGARPVPREAFLAALPTRLAAATAAGLGPAALVDLEIDRLDEHWAVARTRWLAPRPGSEPLVMASTYLLHRRDGAVRITAYLNHEGLPLRSPGSAAAGGRTGV